MKNVIEAPDFRGLLILLLISRALNADTALVPGFKCTRSDRPLNVNTQFQTILGGHKMDLMEMLKALFNGEALTFEQFAEKVNAATDVKLGNLAGGQYVDKFKYDELDGKLQTATTQLQEANEKYKDYDPEWQTKVQQAQADGDKKLNDYKFEQAVEKAISEAGAADVVSVKANLDMSAVTQGEDGTISGLDEQLESLKKEKPFLFKNDSAPQKKLNLGGPTPGTKNQKSGGIKAAVDEFYNK